MVIVVHALLESCLAVPDLICVCLSFSFQDTVHTVYVVREDLLHHINPNND